MDVIEAEPEAEDVALVGGAAIVFDLMIRLRGSPAAPGSSARSRTGQALRWAVPGPHQSPIRFRERDQKCWSPLPRRRFHSRNFGIAKAHAVGKGTEVEIDTHNLVSRVVLIGKGLKGVGNEWQHTLVLSCR